MYTHKKQVLNQIVEKAALRGSAFVVCHFEVAEKASIEINIAVNSQIVAIYFSGREARFYKYIILSL